MDIKNYQNLENGKTDVRESHIKRVSKALGISELELLNIGEKHIYINESENVNNDSFNFNGGVIIMGNPNEKDLLNQLIIL